MIVNHHICFSKMKSSSLLMYLIENAIPFQDTNGLVSFDICQDSIHWPTIESLTKSHKTTVLSETTFSKTELENAEWLSIRSQWHCGYPQPEAKFRYQEITYDGISHCKECGSGLKQVGPFRMKNNPKWGNRHFLMLNWVNDELFVDSTVKNIFLANGITGCDYWPVLNTKGTNEFPQCYQLAIQERVKIGLVPNQERIRAIYTCPYCGRKKFHSSGIGIYQIDKTVLGYAPDICKSEEYFGWGKGADNLILIRSKVYHLLCENKLDRGLAFVPVC